MRTSKCLKSTCERIRGVRIIDERSPTLWIDLSARRRGLHPSGDSAERRERSPELIKASAEKPLCLTPLFAPLSAFRALQKRKTEREREILGVVITDEGESLGGS